MRNKLKLNDERITFKCDAFTELVRDDQGKVNKVTEIHFARQLE